MRYWLALPQRQEAALHWPFRTSSPGARDAPRSLAAGWLKFERVLT